MTQWLDFSGAPPVLIPSSLVGLWRGTIDTDSGSHRDLDTENPKTDYDRACIAAWPGRGLVEVGKGFALVLYSEWDQVSWDPNGRVVACGGWWPSREQIESAKWADPLRWGSDHTDYLLMNSAADGSARLRAGDFVKVELPRGECVVEYAEIVGEYVGGFHRFTFRVCNEGTA
jgi:hypothetical protein